MALAVKYVVKTASADDNSDYTALRTAVLDGKDVRVVLDLSACSVRQFDKPGPAVSGSLRSDAYMIRGDRTIAFAATHFTLRADGTPVDEYLAFQVHSTGQVDARTRFVKATTYAVMEETAFNCGIGRGVTFHW
jgi:hypothetical protein